MKVIQNIQILWLSPVFTYSNQYNWVSQLISQNKHWRHTWSICWSCPIWIIHILWYQTPPPTIITITKIWCRPCPHPQTNHNAVATPSFLNVYLSVFVPVFVTVFASLFVSVFGSVFASVFVWKVFSRFHVGLAFTYQPTTLQLLLPFSRMGITSLLQTYLYL